MARNNAVVAGAHANPWNYASATGGIVNTTTAVTIKAAAGATLSAATTFTLRAKDIDSTNGVLKATGSATSGNNLVTSISWIRLA